MEPEIVGYRMKQLMKIVKINEQQLADNLNMTLDELERKLNGKEEFYISEIMKIKELFHLNLDLFSRLFFEEEINFEEIFTNLYK